eukprot:TRINITY_DN3039_c0_g1_i1.p2 TRINITY_DN3039_c0_g1~~TRINITY_DN3039_c0_g1_i1.p2  ORF type:complete len:101 (-),score=18.22 TRINITY_DN3039_c0_g1_i1:122-424(-)
MILCVVDQFRVSGKTIALIYNALDIFTGNSERQRVLFLRSFIWHVIIQRPVNLFEFVYLLQIAFLVVCKFSVDASHLILVFAKHSPETDALVFVRASCLF